MLQLKSKFTIITCFTWRTNWVFWYDFVLLTLKLFNTLAVNYISFVNVKKVTFAVIRCNEAILIIVTLNFGVAFWGCIVGHGLTKAKVSHVPWG